MQSCGCTTVNCARLQTEGHHPHITNLTTLLLECAEETEGGAQATGPDCHNKADNFYRLKIM